MTLFNIDQQIVEAPHSNKMKATKAFRTISEASKELNVKPHVLRFWETKFSQLRLVKTTGNRRYYREEDMLFLKEIKSLLYEKGFTIKGAQKHLKQAKLVGPQSDHAKKHAQIKDPLHISDDLRISSDVLSSILDDLKELRIQL